MLLYPELPLHDRWRMEPPFRPKPPPRDRWRMEDDDFNDSHFHPRVWLEFPTFNGKKDPLPWLIRCETFFCGQGTPEHHRVWYAAMHLTGVAQMWYSLLELTSGLLWWHHFTNLVQQHFGPSMTDSPLGEIMLLHRVGSVED
jgi:hypothetical protein